MLKNSAEFSTYDLIAIFGETLLVNACEDSIFKGVSTDSREIVHGNIFLALKGENIDGHDKIKDAFSNGASIAIVNKEWFKANHDSYTDKSFVVVADTLNALGKIANYHRRRFEIPIIAIGGSNGKTTTKDLTARVLSQKFNVLKTFENYNNQIGAPLMLLQLDNTYEMAVLEIGTNEPGEIQILSKIIEPTHGLLTNIGKEHLERLIDLDGVEMEETFLFGHLYKNNGIAFINVDDQRLIKYLNLLEKHVTFGQGNEAQVHANITLVEGLNPTLKFSFDSENFIVRMKTAGLTTGLNALAAASVGLTLGVTPDDVKKALESFEQTVKHGYGRMTIEKISGFYIINDCYNANPDSMTAALNTIDKIRTPGKKYVILGDMRELGKASYNEHKSILNQASEVTDEVFCTGEEMKKGMKLDKSDRNVHHFENKDDILNKIISIVKPYDYVLVKGSRGMKMEVIVENIKEQYKRFK